MPGPRACIAPWGRESDLSVHRISCPGEATHFALWMGEATGPVVCSSATVRYRVLNGLQNFLCALLRLPGQTG